MPLRQLRRRESLEEGHTLGLELYNQGSDHYERLRRVTTQGIYSTGADVVWTG